MFEDGNVAEEGKTSRGFPKESGAGAAVEVDVDEVAVAVLLVLAGRSP